MGCGCGGIYWLGLVARGLVWDWLRDWNSRYDMRLSTSARVKMVSTWVRGLKFCNAKAKASMKMVVNPRLREVCACVKPILSRRWCMWLLSPLNGCVLEYSLNAKTLRVSNTGMMVIAVMSP